MAENLTKASTKDSISVSTHHLRDLAKGSMTHMSELHCFVATGMHTSTIKNVFVTSLQNEIGDDLGYLVLLNKQRNRNGINSNTSLETIYTTSSSKIKRKSHNGAHDPFTETDVCLSRAISSSIANLLTLQNNYDSQELQQNEYQQKTEDILKELQLEKNQLQQEYGHISKKMKKEQTNSNQLQQDIQQLSTTFQRKEEEFNQTIAMMTEAEEQVLHKLQTAEKEHQFVLTKTKKKCVQEVDEIKQKNMQQTQELSSKLQSVLDSNAQYETQLLDQVALLEEERRIWKEEKAKAERKHTMKLSDIDRRIRKLQQKLGALTKRCYSAEEERDILLTQTMKQKESHEMKVRQIQDEFNSQLVTSKTQIHNKGDLVKTMKKQLQSMKIKYENVVQKSNAERASMNQMLIRLETQLSEVTEMLRTKNEDVRNYEQRIQVLQTAKERITQENQHLLKRVQESRNSKTKQDTMQIEYDEMLHKNRHLNQTMVLLRTTLDDCRAARSKLSAKMSQLIPAQAASEIEMQKAMDAQVTIKQELIATQKELSEQTARQVVQLQKTTEIKKSLLLSEAENSGIAQQLQQLRVLKSQTEQQMENQSLSLSSKMEHLMQEKSVLQDKNATCHDQLRQLQQHQHSLQHRLDGIAQSAQEVS